MIKELFCTVIVFLSSVIPCKKIYTMACNLVENTFTISETQYDNINSKAVKVFGNSEELRKILNNKTL